MSEAPFLSEKEDASFRFLPVDTPPSLPGKRFKSGNDGILAFLHVEGLFYACGGKQAFRNGKTGSPDLFPC